MRMLRSLRFLVIVGLFLIPGRSVVAQQEEAKNELPDTPAVSRLHPPEMSSDVLEGVYAQDTSKRRFIPVRRTLGKEFWIPWVANIGLTVASVELTEHCVSRGLCVEGNPVLGEHPGRLELYSIRGGALGAAFYFSRRSKLRGTSDWKFVPFLLVPVNAADTAWDAYQTISHSGSPVLAPRANFSPATTSRQANGSIALSPPLQR